MALTRITEGVIKPNENYVVNNINSIGVTTSTNFKTGTSNLHNVGIEIAGINVLGADTPIGTGATIYDAGGAVFTGVVTATSFSGNITGGGNVSGVDATFTGNVSIGGTLTYEDVTNIDSVGLVTARTGLVSPYADIDDWIDVGNHIQLGNAGIVTAKGADINGDIDVDGHTNLDNVSIAGVTTFAGNSVVSGSYFDIQDTKKLRLGTDGDLNLYHQGGANFIKNSSSQIIHIQTDASIRFNSTTGSENILIGEANGPVKLFYDNVLKLSTASSGVNIVGTTTTGQLAVTGISTFGGNLDINASIDVSGQAVVSGDLDVSADIRHIGNTGTRLRFETDTISARTAGDERLRITSGGAIGINTSVPSTAQDLTIDGASNYKAGIFYKQAGVNQYRFMCEGGTGHVYYDTFVNDRDHIFRVDSQSTGGTPVFRIGGDGKVSVGTEQTTHTLGITGGTSRQLLVKGGEADIWLESTGGSSTVWRILGSTGGSTHQFRIYDNTNSADRLVIDSQGRLSCGPGAETGSLSSSLHVRRNSGGTAAGESVIAATMGDHTTMNNAMLTVRNAGNRGARGHGSGSKLASFEFNDKNALTIDKDGLVQIGGDSSVSGTWHTEVYNDSGDCRALLAGTSGAWLQLQDTGSSEKFVIAANGDCNLYSYKNDDSICFNTTTGGATTQMLKLLGDGNIRWFPDGASGVNLHMTSGTSSVVFAANKNGSTGTSWHFKNQNSSGQARTWMEVSDAQCVAMPYAMGGTNILNLYNTTGRDGLNIFANVSSGNQNSDCGAITFNGYAQTNGAWIQGTNELAWGKKDLLLGTSYGTGNNYDTRDWDKPVQRLTYGGWVGMKEAATTNAAVKSLLHIKGTSDNGSADATLTIEDSDDTAGSKEPILAFDGNGTRQGRIMSSDATSTTNSIAGGLFFGVGSSNTSVLQCTGMRTVKVHNDVRGWSTVEYNSIRQHQKMFYSPGNAVATHTILRIRRYWWGWGSYKIRCKAIYYNSSLESTYYVNGHGSGGNHYSISNETFGGSASSNSWNCTVSHIASNNSPGGGSPNVWYADVQVNIPNYYYVVVWVEAWGSSYSTDPTSMHYDSYCLM